MSCRIQYLLDTNATFSPSNSPLDTKVKNLFFFFTSIMTINEKIGTTKPVWPGQPSTSCKTDKTISGLAVFLPDDYYIW